MPCSTCVSFRSTGMIKTDPTVSVLSGKSVFCLYFEINVTWMQSSVIKSVKTWSAETSTLTPCAVIVMVHRRTSSSVLVHVFSQVQFCWRAYKTITEEGVFFNWGNFPQELGPFFLRSCKLF